jgi:hypothetical protein
MKLTIDTDENMTAEQLYGMYVAAKAKNLYNYWEHLKFTPEYRNNCDEAKDGSLMYKLGFESGKKEQSKNSKETFNCGYNAGYEKCKRDCASTRAIAIESGYKKGYDDAKKENLKDKSESWDEGYKIGYDVGSNTTKLEFQDCINGIEFRVGKALKQGKEEGFEEAKRNIKTTIEGMRIR